MTGRDVLGTAGDRGSVVRRADMPPALRYLAVALFSSVIAYAVWLAVGPPHPVEVRDSWLSELTLVLASALAVAKAGRARGDLAVGRHGRRYDAVDYRRRDLQFLGPVPQPRAGRDHR